MEIEKGNIVVLTTFLSGKKANQERMVFGAFQIGEVERYLDEPVLIKVNDNRLCVVEESSHSHFYQTAFSRQVGDKLKTEALSDCTNTCHPGGSESVEDLCLKGGERDLSF